MRRLARFTPVVLLLAVGPGAALAQTGRGVGVVTTLAGTVTVARAALPAPQPLHFSRTTSSCATTSPPPRSR